jgi:hypothetical protein
MAERDSNARVLTGDGARVLSRPTKSQPIWPARTPRWILRFLDASASVPVEGGAYQVNRIAAEDFGPDTSAGARTHASNGSLGASHSHDELKTIATSAALYDQSPQEIPLQPIQSLVKANTRVQHLFSDTHDQLQWQINHTAEFIYETKEDLVFNHPIHGLLNNVAPRMRFSVDGPPAPDVLDDLLARAWKRPDLFALHPQALTEFRKQATACAVTLEEVEIFGSSFSTWRGLPLVPTDKLQLISAAGPPAEPAAGIGATSVLLMRLGLEKQGVVSLHAAGANTNPALPYIAVDFMRLDDDSVASYVMTTYTAVAVLSPGALACAQVQI